MKLFILMGYFDKWNIQVQSHRVLLCGCPALVTQLYEFNCLLKTIVFESVNMIV